MIQAAIRSPLFGLQARGSESVYQQATHLRSRVCVAVIAFAIAAACMSASEAQARAPKPLPLPEEAWSGEWSALLPSEPRWLTFRVSKGKPTELVMAVGVPLPMIFRFRLTETSMSRGAVSIRGVDADSEQKFAISIKGFATGTVDNGRLQATVSMLDDGKIINNWTVMFVKTADGLAEWIKRVDQSIR